MKERILALYAGIENLFHEIKDGVWVKTELGKFAAVTIQILSGFLTVLTNKTVDAILATILPPTLIADIPEGEAALFAAINAMLGIEAGNAGVLEATLIQFVEWLQKQTPIMQDAILKSCLQ